MQMVRAVAAASAGSRVLGEIEETNLDEVLKSFRATFAAPATNPNDGINVGNTPAPTTRPRDFGIGPLNDLIAQHPRATWSAPLAVTGRYHELLYILVATLITPPHNKTVAIVDFEGRFDPLCLLTTIPFSQNTPSPATAATVKPRRVHPTDLDHVHILRPPRDESNNGNTHLADCLASMEKHMLYGTHRSRDREWWGTVVIGGSGAAGRGGGGGGGRDGRSHPMAPHVAVTAGRRGWLRVDRAEVPAFSWGLSAQEAVLDRERRQAAVEAAGLMVVSPWGGFAMSRGAMNPLRDPGLA
ncbi:hypothetical protein VTK26DRAFT_5830 [Humicola hyalothermophila]